MSRQYCRLRFFNATSCSFLFPFFLRLWSQLVLNMFGVCWKQQSFHFGHGKVVYLQHSPYLATSGQCMTHSCDGTDIAQGPGIVHRQHQATCRCRGGHQWTVPLDFLMRPSGPRCLVIQVFFNLWKIEKWREKWWNVQQICSGFMLKFSAVHLSPYNKISHHASYYVVHIIRYAFSSPLCCVKCL